LNVDRVYVLDYKNSLIKVFLRNGDLDFVVGNPKQASKTEKIIPVNLNHLGHIAVSEGGEIFVQSFPNIVTEQKIESFDPFNSVSGTFRIEEPKILPSYVLSISADTKQAEIYGVFGKNSEPFQFIENLYAGEKGKFFVLHRISEALTLSFFKQGVLKGTIEESEIFSFFEKESQKYKITLDTILPDRTGNDILVMLSFFSKEDERFKFRRIYRYKYNNSKPEALLKEFQNPSEVLFASKQTKEFITIETEEGGNSLRLLVHDSMGNHIANKRITFDNPRDRWRELYLDFNDSFYSLKLDSRYLEIYEWK
ncbi:MAG: hypothetical protein N3A69_12805, partial [Leptospiraceae bacterium]|nr:hypothetical protein [Leptospiraceae bacterium]